MFTLKNENIEFSLDTQGKLVHLRGKQHRRSAAAGKGLFEIANCQSPFKIRGDEIPHHHHDSP